MHPTKLLAAFVAALCLRAALCASAQIVPLQQPTATYSQSGYGVATAIEGISDYPFPVDGGWAVLSALGTTGETAVFETASDIGFAGGTRLSFTLIQTHWNPGHTLGRFRLSATTDPRSNFADGLSAGGDVTANWIVLEPVSMSSTNGTVLTKLPDQSILASGVTPATDTYTVDAVTSLTNITGIRIEAMEDPSLPQNGPGRQPDNGNFVISELALRASAVNGFYWTNTLGGNWGDAANWSPNQVPGFTNNVFIAADGTYTVFGIGAFSTLSVGAANGTQTLSALGGGNVVLNGPIVFATNTVFDLSATVYGGAGATIKVFGQMNWVGGLINEPASVTIASNALLNISGASKDLNASLTNAGTVVWTGGDIRLSYYPGGAIYNQPGSVFDVQCDQGILFQRFPAQFVNAGLFRKSASSGATWFDAVPFYNTGTVEVRSGTLDLRNGLGQTAGATILNGGNVANVATIQAGSLSGAGQVFGNLAMSGQLSPGFSAGRLEIQGNYTQEPAGSYRVELGGTIAGTSYDQVLITSNANLAGSVQVCSLNGFVPAPGDRFEIMRFASMSGGVTFSGLNIANGVRLEPVISSTNIVLVATNNPFGGVSIYWTNTLGGDWNTAANWCPNQVPGTNDDAFITQDGNYLVSSGGGGAAAKTLTVGAANGTQTFGISFFGFTLLGTSVFGTNAVLEMAVGGGIYGTGNIIIHGQMNWSAGSVGDNCTLTIATNGILDLSGGFGKAINQTLTNAGTVLLTGTGGFTVGSFNGVGLIYNLAGGVFDVRNDQAISAGNFTTPAFHNAGLFRKSGGTGATVFGVLTFYNTGTVDVQTGKLRFDNYGLIQNAGSTLLNGGNLSFGDPFASSMQIRGGLLGGSGQVEANGTSVTISGQLSPGLSAGRLEVLGNYTQEMAGSYRVELGGTVAGTSYDQVLITSNANLAGSVQVCSLNGFMPTPGDRFEIMRFASMSGGVTFSGLNIANGVRLEPVISATNIVLVATNAPFDAVGIYWTNTLGGSWTDAVNWSPNQVPGPTDQAYIIQDGTYTVTTYGVSVSNLIVGAACGTQTVAIPFTGFFDPYSVRFHGNSQFASNTILNVGGGALWAYLVGDGQITMHGQMNLVGVQLLETVAVRVATNGVLNLLGASVLQGAITNAGRINWTGPGNFQLNGVATIVNLPGGIFDVQTDQVMNWNIRGNVVFHNQGLFRKSAGTGTTTLYLINFFNTGTVEIQSGEVRFSGYSFMQNSGATLLNGGNFSSDVPIFFKGGLLGGSGQLEANGVNVAVSGQLSPGLSAGQVEIQGNYTQRSSGAYNCEIGGTVAGTNHDQVVIASNAVLAGTINVCSINGFTPAPGDQFEIMKFASMSGSVAFTGLDIANGIQLQPVVSATNIVLVAASATPSASPRLNVARNGTDLWTWWPQGYGSFQLQSATNLTAPVQWSPVSLTEPNRAILTPSRLATFFRMISP